MIHLPGCSFIFQGICDSNLLLYDIDVGSCGRNHDSRTFNESPISQLLPQWLTVPGRGFLNSFHIIGDSAYRINRFLMTPYKAVRRALNDSEKSFNRQLSSKRQVIERCFGFILRRWPRLKYLNMKSKEKRLKVVAAACALHNLCILENDMDIDDLEMEMDQVSFFGSYFNLSYLSNYFFQIANICFICSLGYRQGFLIRFSR